MPRLATVELEVPAIAHGRVVQVPSSERVELDSALKRLGELMMDQELLLERCRRSGVSPLVPRRSGK